MQNLVLSAVRCVSAIIPVLLLMPVLQVPSVHAQPSYPVPSGVYCSCGPTNATGPGSVDPAIASKPFVRGILVRVAWSLIEPADGSYNWAQLDTQIARARFYGKKVALAVVNGPSAPAWLYATGVQHASIGAPFNDTIPYPWDPVYLAKWSGMIAQLGARYDRDTTITIVHMTNATANGFEFFLNPSSIFNWNNAGYTDAKIISSWKQVVDAYNAAFPNHYLDNDFHPIFLTANSGTAPGDSVYEYAGHAIGKRYGAFSSWWSQKNASAYPAQYADLVASAAGTFATVQFAYNGTNDSAAFGPGGMPGALQLAIDDGICYWELWNQDILNPRFDSLLSNVTCGPASGVALPHDERHMQDIYPNPCRGELFIQADEEEGAGPLELTVIDALGRTVMQATLAGGGGRERVDVSMLVLGVYIVRLAGPAILPYARPIVLLGNR